MVNVTESYQSGNRRIVVHPDNPDDRPTVYTPEEATDLKQQLDELGC